MCDNIKVSSSPGACYSQLYSATGVGDVQVEHTWTRTDTNEWQECSSKQYGVSLCAGMNQNGGGSRRAAVPLAAGVATVLSLASGEVCGNYDVTDEVCSGGSQSHEKSKSYSFTLKGIQAHKVFACAEGRNYLVNGKEFTTFTQTNYVSCVRTNFGDFGCPGKKCAISASPPSSPSPSPPSRRRRRRSGCLPGSTMVIARSGPKRMSQVRIGEELLAFDHGTNAITFSPVRAWLHRDMDLEVVMSSVQTSAGRIVMTQKHSVELFDGAYVFAEELRAGNFLRSSNGTRVKVLRVAGELGKGLYAPWTGTSNFFAGSSPESLVLTHSFGHVRHAQVWEAPLNFFMAAACFLMPGLHNVHPDDRQYIHPVARMILHPALRMIDPLFGLEL